MTKNESLTIVENANPSIPEGFLRNKMKLCQYCKENKDWELSCVCKIVQTYSKLKKQSCYYLDV